MNIITICAVAVTSAVFALFLRRTSPQISLMISIGAGIIILLAVAENIILTADEIRSALISSGISSEYIMIMLKALGICFVTEFTCDTVSEAGMLSLSTNISFAGKLLTLAAALPLFRDLISLISSMVSAT